MQQITTIIFDFGGVLVDWNPRYLYANVFDTTADMEKFLSDICTDEWNLQQDKGRSLAEGTKILQQLHPAHHQEIQLFYDQWETMLKDQIPENVALLRPLKEKYKLYGLTNWSDETFPIALRRFAFFEYFDGIVVSGKEKMIKPDAEIFNLILLRYQLKPPHCLFIDDNLKNIHTAKSLGFATIHLQKETNLKHELANMGILP